jgi:ribonuclease P protein component
MIQRLKDAEAFQQVYRVGQAWATPVLVLRAAPNQLPHSRVGYSTSKRLGKAVVRNRLKRLLREAVHAHSARIAHGWDIVLVAREPSREATLLQVSAALEQLLKQAKLYVVADG